MAEISPLRRRMIEEGVKAYPARISIPDDLDRAQLRLGMPGSATVFADNAGVIGALDVDRRVDQLLHGVPVKPACSMPRPAQAGRV
jgi:hypothetical protein